MNLLNASDIYNFAVEIEKNGEKFYRKMEEKFEQKEVKNLFNFLAKEEVKHEKVFTDMLSNIDEYQIKESYVDEYKSYLNAYADNLLFSLKNFDKAMEKVEDLDSAFQFAIKKELDTIMYYQELKNIVQENKTDLIEDIINEERKHVVLLTQKKEKLV
ncbi:MAG: ferritin family protein [Candidatus Cloacimonetes bacterium]|nr:ferritin family protein [Candidatus Cloacimonadota bacterium]MBS3767895.1 ferritin family protein [Candidatus Cloacimonadota bacterium]